jgi:hypothetical protein
MWEEIQTVLSVFSQTINLLKNIQSLPACPYVSVA